MRKLCAPLRRRQLRGWEPPGQLAGAPQLPPDVPLLSQRWLAGLSKANRIGDTAIYGAAEVVRLLPRTFLLLFTIFACTGPL